MPTQTPVKNLFPAKTVPAKPIPQPQKITIPQTLETKLVVEEGFKRFLIKRYKGIRRGKRLELIHDVLKEMFPSLEPTDLAA